MPGAFCEAITVGETLDEAQKPRTETVFWKAELGADRLPLVGVELLLTVSGKPSSKQQ